MDLQELITRGRFLFTSAPQRLKVFELVNGRRTVKDIGVLMSRNVNSVRRDLDALRNADLIENKTDKDGNTLMTGRLPVYQKEPLARTVPLSYFNGPAKVVTPRSNADNTGRSRRKKTPKIPRILNVPSEREIIDICKHGEDQICEFKGQGTKANKITHKIGGMLNTRRGGLIFYGIDDDGTIRGSDISRQQFDQQLRNSVHHTISPAATINLHSVSVIGHEIIVIVVPPWNRKDVYQHDERVLLRKGTNTLPAKPEESKKLHRGQYVC